MIVQVKIRETGQTSGPPEGHCIPIGMTFLGQITLNMGTAWLIQRPLFDVY
jgi:hypothetical protein